LNAFVDTAQKKEPEDGRLVQYLLMNPTNDGGQWDMLVNIVGESLSLMEFQALLLAIGHFFGGNVHSDWLPRRLT
jgi:hypothetical protein